MKIIVYSANIGGYDNFNHPKIYDENVRYILFTDNKYIKSNVWEISHTDFLDESLTSRKSARYFKVNPHLVLPEHDISIWVDHCFTPQFNNANDLINKMSFTNDKNIMIFKHSWRDCIYKESEEVIKLKLDNQEIVTNQIDRYKKEGFPENLGLFETGFIVRENNKKVNEFNDVWWNEIKNGSGRDQLSNMYASWKTSLKINQLTYGVSCYNNPFLTQKNNHNVKLSF
jgi:hypothetical protein